MESLWIGSHVEGIGGAGLFVEWGWYCSKCLTISSPQGIGCWGCIFSPVKIGIHHSFLCKSHFVILMFGFYHLLFIFVCVGLAYFNASFRHSSLRVRIGIKKLVNFGSKVLHFRFFYRKNTETNYLMSSHHTFSTTEQWAKPEYICWWRRLVQTDRLRWLKLLWNLSNNIWICHETYNLS